MSTGSVEAIKSTWRQGVVQLTSITCLRQRDICDWSESSARWHCERHMSAAVRNGGDRSIISKDLTEEYARKPVEATKQLFNNHLSHRVSIETIHKQIHQVNSMRLIHRSSLPWRDEAHLGSGSFCQFPAINQWIRRQDHLRKSLERTYCRTR